MSLYIKLIAFSRGDKYDDLFENEIYVTRSRFYNFIDNESWKYCAFLSLKFQRPFADYFRLRNM